jgi:hypothetical protein
MSSGYPLSCFGQTFVVKTSYRDRAFTNRYKLQETKEDRKATLEADVFCSDYYLVDTYYMAQYLRPPRS